MQTFCPPYNPYMHTFHAFSAALVSTLALLSAGLSSAQTAVPATAAANTPAQTSPQASKAAAEPARADKAFNGNQKIERIHVDDGGTRIDEVRVGGETQSITVQPKGNLPSYTVQPVTGARTWKILSF